MFFILKNYKNHNVVPHTNFYALATSMHQQMYIPLSILIMNNVGAHGLTVRTVSDLISWQDKSKHEHV